MSRSQRHATGYSLVELLLAVSVLGIMLAVGTPYMNGYMRSKGLQNSVNDVASRFELARSRAVTEQNEFRVLLNDPADQYRIHDDDNNDGSIDGGEEVLGPFALPAGVRFDSIDLLNGSNVTFIPSGMLEPGQGGSITLADERSRQITLEVFTSGLTQIQICS